MSETHDPWARVRALRPNPYSHENYYVASEVDAARAAEATQRQQELIDLRANYAQSMRLSNDTLADTLARLAAVEAERDRERQMRKQAESDLMAQIDNSVALAATVQRVEAERDAKSRLIAELEGEAKDLKYHPISGIYAIEAERDRLKAVLKSIEFLPFNDQKCPVCYGWDGSKNGRGETPERHTETCALRAALSGEGTAKP